MGRRTGTLVGLRADSGRLPEAGDLRSWPLHGRSDPDGLDAGGTEGGQAGRGTATSELSGTSFAAPVISGLAAQVLARNPSWTPDQVKSALMRRARPVPQSSQRSCGVGQVNAVQSVLATTDTPNPNKALNRFLQTVRRDDGVRRRLLDGRLVERRLLGRGLLERRLLERRLLGCGLLERRLLDGRLLERCLLDATSPGRTTRTVRRPRDGNGYELTPAQGRGRGRGRRPADAGREGCTRSGQGGSSREGSRRCRCGREGCSGETAAEKAAAEAAAADDVDVDADAAEAPLP